VAPCALPAPARLPGEAEQSRGRRFTAWESGQRSGDLPVCLNTLCESNLSLQGSSLPLREQGWCLIAGRGTQGSQQLSVGRLSPGWCLLRVHPCGRSAAFRAAAWDGPCALVGLRFQCEPYLRLQPVLGQRWPGQRVCGGCRVPAELAVPGSRREQTACFHSSWFSSVLMWPLELCCVVS